MAVDKPLPVETLLPFNSNRSPSNFSYTSRPQPQELRMDSQSPVSAEEDDGTENEAERPKRQKRSRACVACRNMKIRCLPVEGQEACLACSKVNRDCVMPGPPRKRQKTVHKVAELEKKINALTDALLAKQQAEPSPPTTSPEKEQTTSASSAPSAIEETSNSGGDSWASKPPVNLDEPRPHPVDSNTACPFSSITAVKDDYVDVVDRGMVSLESATTLFNHWKQHMSQGCPITLCPAGIQAHTIRTQRPMTFLAILMVASSAMLPSVQSTLATEVAHQYAQRVLFHGERSMDLVQAMLLYSQFYVRPRTAKDLAFHQLSQAALTMCYDLGIGKRSRVRSKWTPQEHLELARTWLAACWANISVSTVLRLPTAARFDVHAEECIQVVESSPHALPGDKWMVAQARLSRIAQEISDAFNMCDPGAELNFTDGRTQHQLKYFRRQLDEWEKSVDPSIDNRLVLHQRCSIDLYIHEVALHWEHSLDDWKPGNIDYEKKGPETITSLHIDALATLLSSSHKLLDNYLSLEVSRARALPNLYIVWNAYAIVILIKIHWIVFGPGSKVNSIFASEIKTDYYLDSITSKVVQITAEGRCPCAEAFGFVFKKLKTWHQHLGGMNSDDEQAQDVEARRQRSAQLFGSEPLTFIQTVRKEEMANPDAQQQQVYPPASLPHQRFMMADGLLGTNLNAAYDAASYGNTNWDQFNFSTEEMDMFDVYMSNSGWMGYLL
ncbi:uncharacterized protein PV06_01288 [Exophiala oligosperma]|uniref:Zn(2)-C6 fungal-type domain-containing protein n=1 Tax=Exophiala oligosperma TaxID=215243 RepID=A0A0D2DZZ2_9EURO|nr:uncharacterized protein PV06_01288 [Exophiala oligosperma]KIW48723.1 hypothetical protein PV06_01288 [Exophiala oligosperma]